MPGEPVGKDQARRRDASGLSLRAKIARCRLIDLQQPEHAAIELAQEPHPDVEDGWDDLEAIIEATEHETRIRQTRRPSGRDCCRDLALAVVGQVAVGKMNDLLRVKGASIEWQDNWIRNHVIDEISAHRPGITEIVHLNGCRAKSQDVGSAIL